MYLSETYEKMAKTCIRTRLIFKDHDSYRPMLLPTILENQAVNIKRRRCFLKQFAPANATGSSIDNWDPILIL